MDLSVKILATAVLFTFLSHQFIAMTDADDVPLGIKASVLGVFLVSAITAVATTLYRI